ncbi:Mitochondrial import inner membrane translocase, subunit TIM8 [Handroanthus impetiginosus]|uniref:Mitochondrial import inner membrane translocase subunit n=1 Tax=Handroanthus impetiginosus TaxID=429701 RepID=A0A2G9G555_9LAMI|nr:Mitochondrial import inner membrane translocase, subunit TIM8 [Handroanthus impetiginosus]
MDPNLLAADLSYLSEEDKANISSIIDNFQIRDKRCFSDCVNNFYRKSLGKQEEDCVMRCTKKFLNLSMRVSMRFAELNPDASTQ